MEQTVKEPQVFQNDQVRFSAHYKPGCLVELDVEAFSPLIKEARKRATKQISKEVVLPGFRKGKGDLAIISKKFPDQITKQAEQIIGDIAFQECLKLSNIHPLDRETKISYKMKTHSLNGALLTLTFEIAPQIPHIDPKTMRLKKVKRPEVSEDKINETIRQVQLFFAEWKAVNDRPVNQGDFVLLDVDVIEDAPATSLFNSTRFEVTEKSMAKWMYDLVLGKNQGDSVEGVSIPDESASQEDKELLKPKKVLVKIKEIDEAITPELNAYFLQKIGVKTVEELHTNITHLLNKQADAHVQEAKREQTTEFLLNDHPFDLPPSLIEKETRFRLQQLMADQEFLSYWNSLTAENRTKTITTIYQQSEKAVRMFYLCRKIISDAKIQISTRDVAPAASSSLEMMLNPQMLLHTHKTPEIEHAEAFSKLVLEKAEDYVIAHATEEELEVTKQ